MLFLITFLICLVLYFALMTFDKLLGAYLATVFSIVIFIGVGWIANIIALIGMIKVDAALGSMLIARVAGVFIPPFGAVMGFFV